MNSDDGDDDDDDDELFCGIVDWRKTFSLFPVENIVRDPHYRKSPTHRAQDLNVRRTWVQAFLNEVVY